jgi:hypothetical protein
LLPILGQMDPADNPENHFLVQFNIILPSLPVTSSGVFPSVSQVWHAYISCHVKNTYRSVEHKSVHTEVC